MPDWVHTFPGGMVAESMYVSGDALRPAGSVFGFSSVSSETSGVMVVYPSPDPGRLGSVQVTVSLFLGDTGAIDMDRLAVSWITGGSWGNDTDESPPPTHLPELDDCQKISPAPRP